MLTNECACRIAEVASRVLRWWVGRFKSREPIRVAYVTSPTSQKGKKTVTCWALGLGCGRLRRSQWGTRETQKSAESLACDLNWDAAEPAAPLTRPFLLVVVLYPLFRNGRLDSRFVVLIMECSPDHSLTFCRTARRAARVHHPPSFARFAPNPFDVPESNCFSSNSYDSSNF